jgi:ketosteroid isomerase-like protein
MGTSRSWARGSERPGGRALFRVHLVRDGRITEIQRYDDRVSAAEVAGVRS